MKAIPQLSSLITLSLFLLTPICTAAQQIPEDVIVFTTLRPGNHDIFIADNTEETIRQVTHHPALDYNATFSPDDRWLVFTSERNGNADLYALDLKNDLALFRLTNDAAMDDAADISPDGKYILFVSNRDGNPDIYKMPFRPGLPPEETARKAERLTRHPFGDFNPSFAPDGSKIVFSRQLNSKTGRITDIHIMKQDGSGVHRLTDWQKLQKASGAPVWDPHGEFVYFHSWRRDESGFIGRIRPDSTGFEIIGDRGFHLMPAVSPAGRIAFISSPITPSGDPARMFNEGNMLSMTPKGNDVKQVLDSTQVNPCLAPAYSSEGLLACHGPAKTGDQVRMTNNRIFARPGTHDTLSLRDRSVALVGIRGYFPDFINNNHIVYGEWLTDESDINRFGHSPLVSSDLDGSDRKVLYERNQRLAWDADVCEEKGWIAFTTGPTFASPDTDVDIWKMRSDGTDLQNLTGTTASNNAFPTWSPDCRHIIFRSGRDGNMEIYKMDSDGNNPVRITHHESTDTAPSVSPDGKFISFATGRSGSGLKIWIENLETGEGRYLEPERAEMPGLDMHPQFSPDGKWIVFVSDRGGVLDEYVMSGQPQPYGDLWIKATTGKGPAIRVTNNKWEEGLAIWGKDENVED